VRALAALPSLVSLYMTLYEEQAVQTIITELPRLQYLNGIEIQRDDMQLPLEQIRETDEEESAAVPDSVAESHIGSSVHQVSQNVFTSPSKKAKTVQSKILANAAKAVCGKTMRIEEDGCGFTECDFEKISHHYDKIGYLLVQEQQERGLSQPGGPYKQFETLLSTLLVKLNDCMQDSDEVKK